MANIPQPYDEPMNVAWNLPHLQSKGFAHFHPHSISMALKQQQKSRVSAKLKLWNNVRTF
jgi:hypothetical protein